MKFFASAALLFSVTALLTGFTPQKNNSIGSISVYTKCLDFQDPIDAIRNNKQFFIDRQITVFKDTTEEKCGYLLVKNSGEKLQLGFISDRELLKTCDEFFLSRPLKEPVTRYKLLK